ncbi:Retrovirus-related Pol polyprotein from transposon TNT 1-94 [Gossypium australe]|uniref:Retrovirus-related Pol polyprotein from transposon TNT 1-94 n=1 Tax=Gossypium australe TaxID=47621 RepID=A0A5B6W7V2_9ROSI|nr:Retrovirus-related Pol polyprotein from transposon TNT 1-94 [Gossypium australe]
MFEFYEWKCSEDNALYRKIMEQKRTFKFLLGLNKILNFVKGKIMGKKTSSKSLRDILQKFAKKKVRRRQSTTTSKPRRVYICCLSSQSLAPMDNCLLRKGQSWCDHCSKLDHIRETCWKLHKKSVN